MRLLDENRLLVIDSSHFRFIRRDGNRILFYNDKTENNSPFITFDSVEEAKTKFEELKGEAGWFSFTSNKLPALVNSFGFKEFYVSKDESGKVRLFFYNSENDFFSINYGASYDEAVEDLKGLII